MVPSFDAVHGVAVGFDHYLWAVGDLSLARVDVRAGAIDVLPAITSTTMSDMTGFQLAHVTN